MQNFVSNESIVASNGQCRVHSKYISCKTAAEALKYMQTYRDKQEMVCHIGVSTPFRSPYFELSGRPRGRVDKKSRRSIERDTNGFNVASVKFFLVMRKI